MLKEIRRIDYWTYKKVSVYLTHRTIPKEAIDMIQSRIKLVISKSGVNASYFEDALSQREPLNR